MLAVMVLACSSSVTADDFSGDWLSWRGPQSVGCAGQGVYPDRLDESTTVWKFALPGKGCSTPIVCDRTIYVTAPVNGHDAVLAIDWSGNLKWQAVFGPENPGKHRNGSGCNASPASDGETVFVYFKSGTLAAVGRDGSVRWQTNLVERFGEDKRFWDHGTSPVLTDKYVVMARMHAGDSWLAAFDKRTGELAWKAPRNYSTPLEGDQCYTTPLVLQFDGRQAVLVWGALHLTVHDAESGRVLWSCGNFNPQGHTLWPAISTPVIVDDMIVLCFGRNDRGVPRLHGIRLEGHGDVTDSNHVWRRDDTSAFVPSPAVYQGRVYLVRDRGELECIDPATGKTIWADAFPKARASFYASPVIAGGRLYIPREDGVVFVTAIGDDGHRLLSTNNLDESLIASAVPVANRLFLRGEKHLFCFASSDDDR